MIDHLGAQFTRFLRMSLLTFSDRRRRRAAITEIQGLDRTTRNKILTESGLAFEDLRDAQVPLFSKDLLSVAMRSLGISRDFFRTHHGAWYRDMQLTCMRCRHRMRCREDTTSREFAYHYQDYCVNSDSLANILSGQAERTSHIGVNLKATIRLLIRS